MTVRIEITSDDAKTIVSVAGRLTGVAVEELRNACEPIDGAFVLDLSALRSADAPGLDLIRRLGENGAEVRGASPFVQLLLDAAPREESNN